MVDDLEILARIEKLLQAGRQEIYGGPNDPRTPLVHYKPHTGFNHIPHPLIMIPEGSAAGVSVDPAGNILGIKLASVGRYTDEIFALICDLQHL